MIESFKCKDTEALYNGKSPGRFRAFESAATRKMQMLEAANEPQDLRSPPGNRLEMLSGDRAGQWSIRINSQWRICFRFADGNAYDVAIVDYH
jgi:proteic killer suppression protein